MIVFSNYEFILTLISYVSGADGSGSGEAEISYGYTKEETFVHLYAALSWYRQAVYEGMHLTNQGMEHQLCTLPHHTQITDDHAHFTPPEKCHQHQRGRTTVQLSSTVVVIYFESVSKIKHVINIYK